MSAMTALRAAASSALVAVIVFLGAPAFADSPDTWNSGPSRTPLENIVFFGGSVAGLFIGITIFALLTARNNFEPEPPEPTTEVEPHSHH